MKGIRYDSRLEARVALELEARRRAGELSRVERQVPFRLSVNGRHICTYRADFLVTHPDARQEVIEAKGVMTRPAALKLKLFQALHPTIPLRIIRDA